MIRNRTLFYTTAVLSFIMALMSYRFLALGMNDAFPEMIGHITDRKFVFVAHVTAAPVALILGTMNMLDRRRKKRGTLHRWMGRAYAVAILVGGLSGLGLAIGASGGLIATYGFGLLSILWIATTAQAVRYAMARDFVGHRRWIIRSFALTLAAVTLRLYLPFFMIFGEMTYAQASVWVAWLCWVPNLALAEWWVRR
jgi:uncharacterized membrane protein